MTILSQIGQKCYTQNDPFIGQDPCAWVNAHTKFGSDPPRNQREKLHQLWNAHTDTHTDGENPLPELPIRQLKIQ